MKYFKILSLLFLIFILTGCNTSSDDIESDANTVVPRGNSIATITIDDIDFISDYENGMINLTLKNVSDKIKEIKILHIVVSDENGNDNKYDVQLDVILEPETTTTYSYAYKIGDIKKIWYDYE